MDPTEPIQNKPIEDIKRNPIRRDSITLALGETIWIAAEAGDIEAIKHMIQIGGDVDLPDQLNRTGLHHAAIKNNRDVAELLLRNGAAVDKRDLYGNTPLHFAQAHGATDVIKLLEECGANTMARNKQGKKADDLLNEPRYLTPIEEETREDK